MSHETATTPGVDSVHRSARHTMGKRTELSIRLVEGHGVEGDAHAGATVQHRSRVAKDPQQPNLRQVHLIAAERHEDLAGRGFDVAPGAMGENITTRGLDLERLPAGTRLHLGPHAIVELTGLRNPCRQLEGVQPGLLDAVLARHRDGSVARLAGVMSVVVAGGDVCAGDAIDVELPPGEHRPMAVV